MLIPRGLNRRYNRNERGGGMDLLIAGHYCGDGVHAEGD